MALGDNVTGALCIVMCLAFGVLHVVSGPRHPIWPNIPTYVRIGFLLACAGMLGRGIDLIKLAEPSGARIAAGHIDMIGLILTVIMAYTIVSLAVSISLRHYSARVWAGIDHVHDLAGADRSGVLASLSLQGFKVVKPKGKTLPPIL